MKVGMIGLGKMGFNLALQLHQRKFDVEAFDLNEEAVKKISANGISAHSSITHLMEAFPERKILWMMVPAGEATESVFQQLLTECRDGDIIIDGGNAHYKDSIRRDAMAADKGVFFFDCGTSGGTEGALNGACLMVGGNKDVFTAIEPIFKEISVESGYLLTGPAGSGHYLKMVHNGIEYGMMQAIAEGFEVLDKSPFPYNFKEVAGVFNNGSVIRSWLMELTESAFEKDENLSSIKGVMHSSGEGKWTVEEALNLQTATPIIALSLMMRYRSLETDTFSGKVVAALRNEFGGHAVEKSE
ncbi:phosphogluconate dehydrogenase (NAD(+)-dependent, decarboxylating) [Jeotgalibacillus proteolyticus]|uniref:6-phosphogluconate dehydrogenase (Decarboxylating) n=1 Tax=Jeotgalibacillus proteolyticus TaxID=2082395 RepID=A0A2S5GAH0_9BACL|nr:decarboxylating 6-phosphogluconate dehydrogenase [Jeotgalibacillus proteolyticus]PPA69989.1 6-phosphogluconate dehydrogenase (decarboxylating) [Jeotgalibacillus proteolyticus]